MTPTPEPELDRALASFERVIFDTHPEAADLDAFGRHDRALLYRELVRSRLRDLVASALPRTAALLGREALDAELDARISRQPPRTRFFREVVEQLIDRDAPGLASAEHPHADDLARLELAQFRAMWVEVSSPVTRDFDFAAIPVVTPTMIRLELAWSVHRVDRPLERGAFHVAIYRRRDHVVETRWMNAALAAILGQWELGALPAIDGVKAALSGLGRAPTPELVEAMSGMLAELLERGGVLGSRP